MDVQLFVDHYLKTIGRELSGVPFSVSREAMQILLTYRWPGNIRELANALRQAITIAATGGLVNVQDLPLSVQHSPFDLEVVDLSRPAGVPLSEALRLVTERLERQWIQAAFRSCLGNRTETARALGIDRKTLFDKLHRYRIEDPDG
jgi:DNA-binding NtrC family response regulator